METEATESALTHKDSQQTQVATDPMNECTTDISNAVTDTTPPEPEHDADWAMDDEEDEKWTVLLDRTKYRFVKRTPLRPPTRQHDIYVTTSRQRNVLLRRAHKLLIDERLPFITLHGLGAAIPLAVDIALQLTGEMPPNGGPTRLTDELVRAANENDAGDNTATSTAASPLPLTSSLPASVQSVTPFTSSFHTLSIRTGTEVLIDDYLPLVPSLQPVTQQRQNSSIHITIAVKPNAAAALLTTRDSKATHSRAAAVGGSNTAGGGGGGRGGRGGGGGGRGSGDRGRGRGRGGGGGGGGGDFGSGRGRGGGKHGHGSQQSPHSAKRQKQ